MQATGATEVRKNWSSVCDKVSRVSPEIIKRTHDLMFLISQSDMLSVLEHVKYDVSVFIEDDGSFTVISDTMDIAENAASKDKALDLLAASILEYAHEYYSDYQLYSKSPNRKAHLPYITKAILLASPSKIREEFVCRNGKN